MSADAPRAGVFTQGSIARHIVLMSATGAVGIMAIMVVDFVDLLYIKALGSSETAAAIGFAGNLLFYMTAINIGISVATGVLVARALGAGARERARAICADLIVVTASLMTLLGAGLWWATPALLELLGAAGETHQLASGYLRIVWWSSPAFVLGFVAMAALRASGDAAGAMHCTLAAAAVNAVLDPLLIFARPLSALGIDAAFGLGAGVEGAAWASLLSRLVMAAVALQRLQRRHHLIGALDPRRATAHLAPMAAIAVPAAATSFATPLGDSFITRAISTFGDEAVAAWAVIGRIVPIAFAAVFALSGAIGPIFAQNLAAENWPRVRRVLDLSFLIAISFVLFVCTAMALGSEAIIALFQPAPGERALIELFLHGLSYCFCAVAAIFVCEAFFNNAGHPSWATAINFGRALGAAPLAFLAGGAFGAAGVIAAQQLWVWLPAAFAVGLSYRLLAQLSGGERRCSLPRRRHVLWRTPQLGHGGARPPATDDGDLPVLVGGERAGR